MSSGFPIRPKGVDSVANLTNSGAGCDEVFENKGDPRKGAVRELSPCGFQGHLKRRRDDRIEFGVQVLDALNGAFHKLAGRDLSLADKRCLGQGVEGGHFFHICLRPDG
jgi:hypothetical protein